MMLPAATFRAAGGLDEGYFLHVEDLDLCLRLHRAGVPVYFAPRITAVHHASSSRTGPIGVEWRKTRGFLRYFRIHFRTPRLASGAGTPRRRGRARAFRDQGGAIGPAFHTGRGG